MLKCDGNTYTFFCLTINSFVRLYKLLFWHLPILGIIYKEGESGQLLGWRVLSHTLCVVCTACLKAAQYSLRFRVSVSYMWREKQNKGQYGWKRSGKHPGLSGFSYSQTISQCEASMMANRALHSCRFLWSHIAWGMNSSKMHTCQLNTISLCGCTVLHFD